MSKKWFPDLSETEVKRLHMKTRSAMASGLEIEEEKDPKMQEVVEATAKWFIAFAAMNGDIDMALDYKRRTGVDVLKIEHPWKIVKLSSTV